MGEKIRDVYPITLIGSKLMVELNEGYSKQQGRVIHIQNNKFRYLLKEKDFYTLSSNILRANAEFDYIKAHPDYSERYSETAPDAFDTSKFPFLEAVKASGVKYRIIDVHGSVITLCVHPDDYSAFKNMVKANRGRQIQHPYGKKHGYKYLYQMKEFKMYEFGSVYYEVFCQLPCLSNTPKMWIPLDRKVQASLWENQREECGYSFISDEDYWIYRLSKSFYLKKALDDYDKEFFSNSSVDLASETLREKLALIVFSYTDRLLTKVISHSFDGLVVDYYSYREY